MPVRKDREALDPSLKKDEWIPEEDEQLMQAYARLGSKWGQVGIELKRGGLGCRNRCARLPLSLFKHLANFGIFLFRWRMLERRHVALVAAQIRPAACRSPRGVNIGCQQRRRR